MSEWISVKDRLPNKNGRYLVNVYQENEYDAGGEVLMAWYEIHNLPFAPGSIGWSFVNEFYTISDELRNYITHWMPLPDPPETVERKEDRRNDPEFT